MKNVILGDILQFARNGASIKQAAGRHGVPITRIETIWDGKIDTNRFGFADIYDVEPYRNYLLCKGDILMTHINSAKHLGKCALYDGEPNALIHGMNLLCLRTKLNICFPEYLKYYFESPSFKTKIAGIMNQSVNQASFSAGNLKRLQIPLPPLEQQKKIATILDAADVYRQKTKALIAKYDELTQSLFLDMFGDPVKNEKGWEVKTFEQMIVFDTTMISDFEKYGDYPHVGIANIEKETGKILDCLTAKEEGLTSGKYLFDERHIIYSKIRPNLNKVALPNFKGLCSADAYPLLPVEDVSSRIFMAHLLRSESFLDFILQHSTRTNIPKANKEQMKQYKGICPPINLQNQFAERVQAIEEQKAQAQASLEKAEELFNSLLQRAFKGELM